MSRAAPAAASAAAKTARESLSRQSRACLCSLDASLFRMKQCLISCMTRSYLPSRQDLSAHPAHKYHALHIFAMD